MSRFRKIAAGAILIEIILFVAFNVLFAIKLDNGYDREYRVDIKRVENALKAGENVRADDYDYVLSIVPYDVSYETNNDYTVVTDGERMYAVEYRMQKENRAVLYMNVALVSVLAVSIVMVVYIDRKILSPFYRLSNYSVELAKGNLTAPVKADRNKFFGKFLWGMDMLRDNLETNKKKELELQKEKKTLIMSISHDIKTPLSAIRLYTKALREGIYDSETGRMEALEGIGRNADDIERYVSEIISASREDFLNLSVEMGEVYLQDIITKVCAMYSEKLSVLHTEFTVGKYNNCLLRADADRLIEVLQNIFENTIKYGDGRCVHMTVEEEEDCMLIAVENSGCSVREEELPHIFNSFYRGANSEGKEGSGLGLYIARTLMRMMDGDIYAEISGDSFRVVSVVREC